MILAAGKGDRMRPLTLNTPKPLLVAGGKSLICHQIEKLRSGGYTNLVINHAWLGDQVEAALGDGKTLEVSIAWSRETEPLETAGGLIQALPLLQEGAVDKAFVCVNSDIWTDYSFNRLPEVDGKEMLAWLVLVTNPAHHPEGDFILKDGKVFEPETETLPAHSPYTYSGIAVYHPALFAGVAPGKKSVVPLLKKAMAQGLVGGEVYTGPWFDIGTPQRLNALDELLTQKSQFE